MASVLAPLKGVSKQDWRLHNDTKARINTTVKVRRFVAGWLCLQVQETKIKGAK